MTMPHMRSPQGCFDCIHAEDPDSTVSLHLIRQLVAIGKVKSVRAGRRILVNYDDLLLYLCNPDARETQNIEFQQIRRVRA